MCAVIECPKISGSCGRTLADPDVIEIFILKREPEHQGGPAPAQEFTIAGQVGECP
jgi:hypothetical protein